MAKNPVNHSRCKHIPIRYHFTRQAVEEGEVVLVPVASKDNVADFLTKALPKSLFQKKSRFRNGSNQVILEYFQSSQHRACVDCGKVLVYGLERRSELTPDLELPHMNYFFRYYRVVPAADIYFLTS